MWQVNAQGIRADRQVAAVPADPRVLIYGDSEAFGWSVNLEDTFQRVIERAVSGSELVNLGVPGYNIREVALHVERTAAALRPDLLIYLVHPNDFEPPMTRVSEVLLSSELMRRVLFAYVMLVVEERNELLRRSEVQLDAFHDGMRRIVGVCRQLRIDCVAAFLDGGDIPILRRDPELARYYFDAQPPRVHDLSSIKASFLDVDRHLPKEAHQEMAVSLAAAVRSRRRVGATP